MNSINYKNNKMTYVKGADLMDYISGPSSRHAPIDTVATGLKLAIFSVLELDIISSSQSSTSSFLYPTKHIITSNIPIMSQVTTSSTHITTKVLGDQPISLANLSVLDADKLAANDPSERAKLMKAAQSLGFFYLSVGSASEHVRKGLQTSYEACNEYFKLPADEKMKFFRANVDRG